MQVQINRLKEILAALETISINGIQNAGTFYNCGIALSQVIRELENLEKQPEE